MDHLPTLEELKDRGQGRAAPAEVVGLFRDAFARFGTRALWSWRADIAQPTITQALAVAGALRQEGDLAARALASEIEQACRAAL